MLTDKERLVLIEHTVKITDKGDSKRVEMDFHEWCWLMDLAEEALTVDDLTTAQRLVKHLDANAKEYYEPIKKETEKVLNEKD